MFLDKHGNHNNAGSSIEIMHCFETYSSPKLTLFPAENKDTVLQPVLPFSLKKKITTSRQRKNENRVGWSVSFTFYFVLTFCYSLPWIKRGHFYHLGFSSPPLRRLFELWYWGPCCSFSTLLMLFLNSAFETQHHNHRCSLGCPSFHRCAGSAPCDSITDWKILAEWGRGQ